MSLPKKQEVITFKVDESLASILKTMPNRSEFIRSALCNALKNICPLCKGEGIFTPKQWQHWQTFQKKHFVEECADCHSYHLVCSHERKAKVRHH